MARETVAVHGLKEFLKACAQADDNVRKEVRETFREVGDIIKHDATRRFSPINSRVRRRVPHPGPAEGHRRPTVETEDDREASRVRRRCRCGPRCCRR